MKTRSSTASNHPIATRTATALLIALVALAAPAVYAQAQVSLIPTGAVWKYFAAGTNPVAGWAERDFDDVTWWSGPGKLGFGELDEATRLNPFPDGSNPLITAYFRHGFPLPDAALGNLTASLLCDDGAVVYLNGREVFRRNIPPGLVSYSTLASSTVGGEDERTFFSTVIPESLLVSGTNVVAVEVHQSNPMSTDLGFELELTAQSLVTEPPVWYGVLRFEVYSNVFGTTLASLTNDTRFPASPDSVDAITSFQTPFGLADNYGARVSGFLLPPVTGDYVFYLASDDQGALFLSCDSSPSHKSLIAWEPTWAPPGQWIGGGTRTNNANISAPIPLEAGRMYFVEALLKENGGGDALGVAWQLPGQPPPVNGSPAIPGEFLAACAEEPTTNVPPSITQQPASVTNVAGQTATFSVQATGTPPFSYQWLFNDFAIPGAESATLTRPSVQLGDAGRFQCSVTNAFGAATSVVATLTVLPVPTGPGSLDLSFDPCVAGQQVGIAGDRAWVGTLARQPDGRILLGGYFIGLNGRPRMNIGRLNIDGSLDSGFAAQTDGRVNQVALQPDGGIVLVGAFTSVNGAARSFVARLNPDGSLDPAFAPVFQGTSDRFGAGTMTVCAADAQGCILVGGSFLMVNGLPRTNLARLLEDGSVDASFVAEDCYTGLGSFVRDLFVLSDGRLLVVPSPSEPGQRLLRLHPDGRRDIGFYPRAIEEQGAYVVWCVTGQPDGGILAAFNNQMVRLNADGSSDGSFNSNVSFASGSPRVISLLPDRRIVVGGGFTGVNSSPRRGIARLHANGALDETFNPGALVPSSESYADLPLVKALLVLPDGDLLAGAAFYGAVDTDRSLLRLNPDGSRDGTSPARVALAGARVLTVLPQPDGRVLIGGHFTAVNGQPRNCLARLLANGTVDSTFDAGSGPHHNPGSMPPIEALALQPDGRLLVGGRFASFGGLPSPGLVRVYPEGELDTTFVSSLHESCFRVGAIALQPDGRILVGGSFRMADGAGDSLVRLHPDGRHDGTFQPDALSLGEDDGVFGIVVQPDDKILVCGEINTPLYGLVRFNADGSTDPGFNPPTEFLEWMHSMAWQPDGKIVAAGRQRLSRFLADGGLDFELPLGGSFDYPALGLQPDGGILFSHDGRVRRLRSGGDEDLIFQTVTGGAPDSPAISDIQVQNDGRVLIGGYFSSVNHIPVTQLARLNNNIATTNLAGVLDAPNLAWTTGGDGLWFAQSFVTHDGQDAAQSGAIGDERVSWIETTVTGPGVANFWWKVSSKWDDDFLHFILDGESKLAISGEVDWEPRGYAVPAGSHTLRWAYCKNDEGRHGLDAGWLDEVRFTTNAPPAPQIVAQPRSQAVPAEESVVFNVAAAGVEPFHFQWRHNGTVLAGETRAPLLIPTVRTDSAGDYTVVVSGPGGSVASDPGRLTVLPPPAAWTWARQGFGTNRAFATCAATDPAGNLFVLGRFEKDVLQFGSYTLSNPSNGWAMFLVKFTANGDVLWAQQSRAIGALHSAEPQSLAVDANGNACVAGDLFGSIALGSQTITASHVDNFVAKFSSSGEVLWAQTIGGRDYDSPAAVSVGPSGHVYVLGHFMQTMQLGTNSLTSLGGKDFYLAKLDGAGQVLWVRHGRSAGYDAAVAPAVDATGNLYVLGALEQGGAFGNHALPSGHFLLKFSPDGQVLWSRSDPGLSFFDRSRPAVDAAGNIYLPGTVYRSAQLGTNILIPANEQDFCLAKLNADGNVLWVRQTAFADRRAGFNGPITAALDGTGAIYVCGYPFGLVDFAGHFFSCDSAAALVLKFDPAGGFLWGKKTARFGWTPGNALALGGAGQVFLAGSFYGAAQYGTTKLTAPQLDALVLRLDENSAPTPFVERQLPASSDATNLACEVVLLAHPPNKVSVYAVEDQPPANWAVTNISHDGVFDPTTGKVKFGPFFDHEPRTLRYQVLTPARDLHCALGVFCFHGQASADGVNSRIEGQQCLVLSGSFPADMNPADRRISIQELTAYGAAWRHGSNWLCHAQGIPIDYVSRAAFLWRAGECYEIASLVTNEPLWWVACDVASPVLPGLSQPKSLAWAVRRAPAFFVPGEPLTMTLSAAPAGGAAAYALEDQPPAGWIVSDISSGGEFDPLLGKVKWGPFPDTSPRRLTYQVTPPRTASGPASFSGVGSSDGVSIQVSGPREPVEGCRLQVSSQPFSGQFQFTFHGRAGANFLIETSSDLITWSPWTIVSNPNGELWFLTTIQSDTPQCFFRARLAE